MQQVRIPLVQFEQPGNLPNGFLRNLENAGDEEPKPGVPVAMRADPLKKLVIVLPVRIDVVRQIEQRLRQAATLDQKQRDHETAESSIAVQERVYGLELLVHER